MECHWSCNLRHHRCNCCGRTLDECTPARCRIPAGFCFCERNGKKAKKNCTCGAKNTFQSSCSLHEDVAMPCHLGLKSASEIKAHGTGSLCCARGWHCCYCSYSKCYARRHGRHDDHDDSRCKCCAYSYGPRPAVVIKVTRTQPHDHAKVCSWCVGGYGWRSSCTCNDYRAKKHWYDLDRY